MTAKTNKYQKIAGRIWKYLENRNGRYGYVAEIKTIVKMISTVDKLHTDKHEFLAKTLWCYLNGRFDSYDQETKQVARLMSKALGD